MQQVGAAKGNLLGVLVTSTLVSVTLPHHRPGQRFHRVRARACQCQALVEPSRRGVLVKQMEDRAVDAIQKTWDSVFKEAHDQYEEDTKAAMEVIRKHKQDFDAKKDMLMATMVQVEGEQRAKRVANNLQAYMGEQMVFGLGSSRTTGGIS